MKMHSRLAAGYLLVTFLAGLLIVGCTTSVDQSQSSKAPLVKTTHGVISGSVDDGIYSFKGIPYAKAERFMPPQAPDSWKGVRDATRFGPIAMQVNSWSPEEAMDEHKLFTVNVWTQGINDGKKRPVMFWLHGGGFAVGASDDPITDGKMLAQKGDVVLVSVNHRLNIMGFLDLSSVDKKYADSANVGMLDAIAALKWVNKNIKNFGGDPDNVTILGESGGGGKVGTLMAMPAAHGLFHKAIIQSGTLVNIMTKEQSTAIGEALVEEVGDLNKLLTMPYKELVAAGDRALAKTVGVRTPGSLKVTGFVPVPDGVNLVQQPFTPGFAEFSKNIPLLIGTTLNELVRTAYGEKDLTLEQAKTRLQSVYGDNTDKYIALYAKSYQTFTPQDLLSLDTVFRPTTIKVADAWSAASNAPVYAYLLTWKSPVDDASKGSFHGLDIPLAFKNLELGKHWTGSTEESHILAEQMSSAWINFARTGNPNADNLPAWKAYTRENGETLIFDVEPKIVNHHDRELMEFVVSQPK
jgi:para-nitrobenzyl esterase